MLTVRHSVPADLDEILRVIRAARAYMKATGNPTQWGDDRPPQSAIERDIAAGNSYVVTDPTGRVCGTFAFIIGDDATYRTIDGAWLNDAPYGTVHRMAADGTSLGVFAAALNYCSPLVPNLRIDTHRDNATMLHLIEKHGFTRCGIITVDDGTERIAFQKVL